MRLSRSKRIISGESPGGVIRLLRMQICSHESTRVPMKVRLSGCLQKDALRYGMGWEVKKGHVIQDGQKTRDLGILTTTLCLQGTCRLGTYLL